MELPQDIKSCHALIQILQEQNGVLRRIVEQQAKRIEELEQKNAELEVRVKELEIRLNQNSRNSHRPPSSDVLDKKKKKGEKTKSKGKQGRQKGHSGYVQDLSNQIDELHIVVPEVCACGQSLAEEILVLKERRQVWDIPPPELWITEYQQMSCTCPGCGLDQAGQFPDEVKARIQYGSGVKALVSLLSVNYRLPVKGIKRLVSDLYGQAPNESTILNMLHQVSACLTPIEACIKTHLLAARVVHVDETGLRCEKTNHWMHVFSTTLFTYLFVHPKRGKEAMDSEQSLLGAFAGYLVHDCWKSYFAFTQCLHALCGAHLMRELEALIEQNTRWAVKMQDLLRYAYHFSDRGQAIVPTKIMQSIERQYQQICKQAEEEEPPAVPSARGKPKQSKGRNLMDRLKTYQDAVLAFAKHSLVPFTNNQAERDIRHTKIKMKISGNINTQQSAEDYATIAAFISTLRKHQLAFPNLKISIFEQLHLVVQGKFNLDILGGGVGGEAA